MQSGTKIAVASLAMLLLGSSASIAQPYGYRPYGQPYGYGPIGNNGPTPGYCGPHTANMTNWILDPATGQPITEAQYLARYPSNPATWTYDCNTGLWTDNGAQSGPGYYAPQAQYYGRDRGYERGREYARDRDRERERERERERDRDRDYER